MFVRAFDLYTYFVSVHLMFHETLVDQIFDGIVVMLSHSAVNMF